MSIFRSAIQGDDGQVDAGYLALYWTMAVTVGVIPLIVIIGGIATFLHPGPAEIIQSTGIAVGAMCTGGAAVIGAVGVFRMGDKPHAQAASTTTTRTQETTTSGAPGATTDDPLKVAVVDMPDKATYASKTTNTTKRKRGR